MAPADEEQEQAYCEHELATILMGECRDLPPGYDQLRRRPIRGDHFQWSYREAALVCACPLTSFIVLGKRNSFPTRVRHARHALETMAVDRRSSECLGWSGAHAI